MEKKMQVLFGFKQKFEDSYEAILQKDIYLVENLILYKNCM